MAIVEARGLVRDPIEQRLRHYDEIRASENRLDCMGIYG